MTYINMEQRKFQVVGKGNKQRWCFYSEDAEIALKDYIKYYRHSASRALFTAQHPTTKVITPVSYEAVNADWRKVSKNNLGKAFDSSTGFKLPNGATRSPDAS